MGKQEKVGIYLSRLGFDRNYGQESFDPQAADGNSKTFLQSRQIVNLQAKIDKKMRNIRENSQEKRKHNKYIVTTS